MSKIEKFLVVAGLGGVLLNKIIPNEYARPDAIALGISALSSVGLLISRTYHDTIGFYPLDNKKYDSNDFNS